MKFLKTTADLPILDRKRINKMIGLDRLLCEVIPYFTVNGSGHYVIIERRDNKTYDVYSVSNNGNAVQESSGHVSRMDVLVYISENATARARFFA